MASEIDKSIKTARLFSNTFMVFKYRMVMLLLIFFFVMRKIIISLFLKNGKGKLIQKINNEIYNKLKIIN